jgi:hypothetical protein
MMMLGGLFLLQGCIAWGATQWHAREWSQPTPLNQDGWTYTGAGLFLGPGLSFDVKSLNERESTITMPWFFIPLPAVPTWKSRYTRPFAIQIAFEPKDERFTFDPSGVTLKIGDGPAIKPSEFSRGRPRCDEETDTDAPFRVTQGTCVLVKFDREPPAPSQPFALIIQGIEHDRIPVLIPPIRFKRGASDYAEPKFHGIGP